MNMNEARKYKVIIISLITVNIVIIGIWWIVNLKTRSGKDNPHGDSQWRINKHESFEDALGLDSLQRKKFKELSYNHMAKIGCLNNRVDSLKKLIQNEIFAQQPDQARIDSLFNNISLNRTMIDTSIFHHFKRLKAECNENQAVVFDSLINNFFSRRDRFRGNRDRGERPEPPQNIERKRQGDNQNEFTQEP
jgi:hypothetical protein